MIEESNVAHVHREVGYFVEGSHEEEDVEIVDWERCRARIEHEDKLINNRANLFLVFNGMGAVVVDQISTNSADLFMAITIVCANILWLFSSSQSVQINRALTKVHVEEAHDPVDKVARLAVGGWPQWLKSTNIMGLYLPLLLTSGWLIAIFMY